MHSFTFRNVNEAFSTVFDVWFRNKNLYREISPRGVLTLELKEPFATTYRCPEERVLFNPVRDANHYFHFFESLWILAGRNDVGFLHGILPRIGEYSDNGIDFHGAYGARLMMHDQLEGAIRELKRDPETRRAVVALWQPEKDAGYTGKDMPCNLMATFKIRDGVLNLVVFNRSNDLVWGAYGANAVQFSFLQEFVAGAVGFPVGTYTQISDSLHIYPGNPPVPALMAQPHSFHDPYKTLAVGPISLLCRKATHEDWVSDLHAFFEDYDTAFPDITAPFKTYWWNYVAVPMWDSLQAYKDNNLSAAIGHAVDIYAGDWRVAVTEWLQRRVQARKAKEFEYRIEPSAS